MKKRDEQNEFTDDVGALLDGNDKAEDLRRIISGGKGTLAESPTQKIRKSRGPGTKKSAPAKACTYILSLRAIKLMEDNLVSNKSKFIDWLITEHFKKKRTPWFGGDVSEETNELRNEERKE